MDRSIDEVPGRLVGQLVPEPGGGTVAESVLTGRPGFVARRGGVLQVDDLPDESDVANSLQLPGLAPAETVEIGLEKRNISKACYFA